MTGSHADNTQPYWRPRFGEMTARVSRKEPDQTGSVLGKSQLRKKIRIIESQAQHHPQGWVGRQVVLGNHQMDDVEMHQQSTSHKLWRRGQGEVT